MHKDWNGVQTETTEVFWHYLLPETWKQVCEPQGSKNKLFMRIWSKTKWMQFLRKEIITCPAVSHSHMLASWISSINPPHLTSTSCTKQMCSCAFPVVEWWQYCSMLFSEGWFKKHFRSNNLDDLEVSFSTAKFYCLMQLYLYTDL